MEAPNAGKAPLLVVELLNRADAEFLRRTESVARFARALVDELLFLNAVLPADRARVVAQLARHRDALRRLRNKAIRHRVTERDVRGLPLAVKAPPEAAERALRRAIGGMVRQARREAGMPQEDLAAAAGTGQAAISRLEAGVEGVPGIERLDRIARVCGKRLVVRFEDDPEATVAEVGAAWRRGR